MGKTLFDIGLILVIIAGILYAIKRFNLVSLLQQKTEPPARTKQVGLRADEGKSFIERMASLPSNALLTMKTPDSGRKVQLQVVCPEILECFGDGDAPRNIRWNSVLCVSEPNWTDAQVLLLNTDEFQYVLKRRRVGPEVCSQFQPMAKLFAHRVGGQLAGSHSITYDNQTWPIQDVGLWTVNASVDRPHVPTTVMCRWIIAHSKDGTQAIVIEDGKGNFDSIWEGYVVNLNRTILDVLTEEG